MGSLKLEQMITFLLDTPMFGDLDADELSQVVHIMEVQKFGAGEVVFEERSTGDAWFVVYSGEVEVLKRSGGESRRVVRLGERACFGEMAILDGSTRSATVRALSDVKVFRFPRAAFGGLLTEGNIAAYKLVHQIALVLAARQRQTTRRLVELLGEEDAQAVRRGIEPLVHHSAVTE